MNTGFSILVLEGTIATLTFVFGPISLETQFNCNLRAPGTYTLALAVYGDNIQSTKHTVHIKSEKKQRTFNFSQSSIRVQQTQLSLKPSSCPPSIAALSREQFR